MKFTTKLACLLGVALTGSAEAQQLDLEALARQPGFVVEKKTENGAQVIYIRKATVVIRQTHDGSVGIDSDGAILCAWHIFVNLKLAADFCFPHTSPSFAPI